MFSKRAEISVSRDQLRVLCIAAMACDTPSALPKPGDRMMLHGLLDDLAIQHGFDDWIDAYMTL